ncbi:hypothetical protein B9479_000647 [Cryptococcus floricola]|uniref:SAP domain-containing protein n=1 Tax=Cryptococcus floricola TaxID=2591691 RepID=A0A5D3B781_9TREE|nr:hypothetical protein B9479_000647 [Cryptococcus floricola]
MLRRRLSTGILRAAAPAPTAAPIAHHARSRSLASAVLLSSERNWKTETVVGLKAELKKRGLSQKGNKATLISRIESAETTSLLGPLPPFPTGARSLSTSSPAAFPPKKKTSSAAKEESHDVAPGVSTTDPALQVESQRTAAVHPDPVAPEQITVAPGLPESKSAAGSGSSDLRIPITTNAEDSGEIEQVIPLTPDNFASNSALPSSSSPSEAPKVLTVASASTHHAGGPVHGVHGNTDAYALEASELELPSFSGFTSSILNAPSAAWNALSFSLPKAEKKDYKYEKRALDDHERTGAWILAGVIGTGLLVGGPKKEKKSHGDVAHGVEAAASQVKGDAQWEKASGAGVVGHGSRKD